MTTSSAQAVPPIDGFQIGRELGRGAMGVVYEAVHDATGSRVALKIVRTPRPRALLAVENEVAAMARLNHPHLLFLYDWGLLGEDAVWMALEYASGGTLEHWRPTCWDEVLELTEPILAGLSHAHARGLVHRDLKPENLLRCTGADRRPGLKIADFGLAWATSSERGASRGGTPNYIPPEQFDRQVGPNGPWSDLYTFGAVLWHWLTGRPVFQGEDPLGTARAHLEQPVPAFQPRFPVPSEVEPLLRELLAKAPEDRPQRVAEVVRRLPGHAGRTLTVVEHTPSSPLPGMGLGLLAQRALPLVGRRAQQDRLVDLLQRVRRRGRPTVAVLLGPEGVGRAHLMRWLTGWAEENGLATRAGGRALARELADRPSDRTRLVPDPGPAVQELAFANAPLLLLCSAERREDRPELEGLPEVVWLDVPPLEAGDFRHLLAAELGLHPDLVLRLGEPVGHSPGRVVQWLAELAAGGRLLATPKGVELVGPLSAPPTPSGSRQAVLTGALSALGPEVRAGLRLGALLGTDVRLKEWGPLLARHGLQPRSSGVRALVRAGIAERVDGGWRWSDEALRQAMLSDGSDLTEAHRAAAEVLAERPDRPERRLRRARHLLEAGQLAAGLPLLLTLDDADMELQRQAVAAARVHLHHGTVDQQLRFATMEARTVMNLLSAVDAVPYAERGLQLCAHVERDTSVERRMFAAVLTHGGRPDEALALLEGLPEDASMLRLRGLLASDRGDLGTAARCYQTALQRADEPTTKARLANSIGTLYCRLGRFEEGLRWLQVAADTLEPWVRYVPEGNLALALLELGRVQQALPHAVRAREGARGRGPRRAGYGALLCAFAAALARREDLLLDVREQAAFVLRSHHLDDRDVLRALSGRTEGLPPVCRAFLEDARASLAD